MAGSQVVVVSNRGPLSFHAGPDGQPVPGNVGGGLAGALVPLLSGSGATWVASAMSDADREAASRGMAQADGIDFRMVATPPDVYRLAYDVVANATLWFVHHHLFDLGRRPRFDRRFVEAWEGYRHYNQLLAQATAEVAGPRASVLVQDYHLYLLPAYLRSMRPDLRVVHFSHTPFADPAMLRVLPTGVVNEMLSAMSAARRCGFHSARWEWGYRAGCAEAAVTPAPTFVSPLAVDEQALKARVADPACAQARDVFDELVGDRRAILRVDRMEPSKNLLRGLAAYDELLGTRADLHGRVVMVAIAYGSRQSLPEYRAYAAEAEQAAQRLNDTWGGRDWTPLVLETGDDPTRSLAALTRYDVLLVNPIRDGLNLVAKDGPLVNENNGVLALSREAGAYAELAGPALEVHPFDICQTAAVIGHGLDMPSDERSARARALREVLARRTPGHWLSDLLAAAER
ncbi:MAG: alpha,alpha-trehalose-phosphate synthase (UDP-forming) [Acidimicrobiales bacterium]